MNTGSRLAERRAFIERLSACLGRPAKLSDLDGPTLAAAIRRVSATSALCGRRFRMRLLELCEMLHALGAIPAVPDLPRPAGRYHMAFSRAETTAIFEALHRVRGVVGKVQARRFWPALMATAWDARQPPSQFLSAPCEAFDLDGGQLRIGDQPTPLHPATVAALRRVALPDAQEILAWPFHRSNLYLQFRRIMVRAGVIFCNSGEFQRLIAAAHEHGDSFHPLAQSKGPVHQ